MSAGDLYVGRVAASLLIAQEDLIEAQREALADGDKGWVAASARQQFDTILGLWLTLLGLRLADQDQAMELARGYAKAQAVGYLVPF